MDIKLDPQYVSALIKKKSDLFAKYQLENLFEKSSEYQDKVDMFLGGLFISALFISGGYLFFSNFSFMMGLLTFFGLLLGEVIILCLFDGLLQKVVKNKKLRFIFPTLHKLYKREDNAKKTLIKIFSDNENQFLIFHYLEILIATSPLEDKSQKQNCIDKLSSIKTAFSEADYLKALKYCFYILNVYKKNCKEEVSGLSKGIGNSFDDNFHLYKEKLNNELSTKNDKEQAIGEHEPVNNKEIHTEDNSVSRHL